MSWVIKVVKPPLYKLDIPGAPCLTNWHWVRLRELAEVVGMPAREVYSTFKDLAVSDNRRWFGAIHWVHEDGRACCAAGCLHTKFPDDGNLEDIFVPAGWSEDVLLAHKHGVRRLERVMIYTSDIPWLNPNNGYVRVFNSTERGPKGEDAMAVLAHTDTGVIGRDGSREFLRQLN